LLRPRQTWMPYTLPRSPAQQDVYNRQLRDAYASTRRTGPPPAAPATATRSDPIADVKELARLHDSGILTDAEFAAAKARVLDAPDASA
jgi:putative oligomerization/nucleic acid binding protein